MEKQEEKYYLINEKLANAILQYLGTKPFAEVFEFIGQMQQMSQFDPSSLNLAKIDLKKEDNN